jgi:hypothetical protein
MQDDMGTILMMALATALVALEQLPEHQQPRDEIKYAAPAGV